MSTRSRTITYRQVIKIIGIYEDAADNERMMMERRFSASGDEAYRQRASEARAVSTELQILRERFQRDSEQ